MKSWSGPRTFTQQPLIDDLLLPTDCQSLLDTVGVQEDVGHGRTNEGNPLGTRTARSDRKPEKVLRIPAILVNRVSWKPNTW